MDSDANHTKSRKQERFPCEGSLEVTWSSPNGEVQQTATEVIDVSYEGMQVTSCRPLPVAAMVQVRGEVLRGFAWVRYSEQHGRSFLAGLNLISGMTWTSDEC